jgi:hypothetical protein
MKTPGPTALDWVGWTPRFWAPSIPRRRTPADRERSGLDKIRADELSAAGHASTTWCGRKGCINGVEDFVGDDDRTTVSHCRMVWSRGPPGVAGPARAPAQTAP